MTMENISPKISNSQQLIMVGIGALCAGIIIGFKLAGGEKIMLEDPRPTEQTIVGYDLIAEVDETETSGAEND